MTQAPTPGGIDTTLAQREVMAGRDRPKQSTMNSFFALAPDDLNAPRAYRTGVAAYQQALKRIMYPLPFGGARAADLHFEALPRHHFARAPEVPRCGELLGIWC